MNKAIFSRAILLICFVGLFITKSFADPSQSVHAGNDLKIWDCVGQVVKGKNYFLYYTTQDSMNVRQWRLMMSNDMMRWVRIKLFEAPAVAVTRSEQGILGGDVVLDSLNTSGLGKNTFLAYYNVGNDLAAMKSKDGFTWEKLNDFDVQFSGNDKIGEPKVSRDEKHNRWIMTLNRDGESTGLDMYESKDLVHWNFVIRLMGLNHSAKFYSTLVDGQSYTALYSSKKVWLGDLGKQDFIPAGKELTIDEAEGFRFTGIWQNHGKEYMLALINDDNANSNEVLGRFTFPREITYQKVDSEFGVVSKPASNLKYLFTKELNKSDRRVIPGINKNPMSGMRQDTYYLTSEINISECNSITITPQINHGAGGTPITYNCQTNNFQTPAGVLRLGQDYQPIHVDFIVDHGIIEMFVEGGKHVITISTPYLPSASMSNFSCKGGIAYINEMKVYPLNVATLPAPKFK